MLEATLRERRGGAGHGSYTRNLFDDPQLLRAKLLEEAAELAQAKGPRELRWEAADLIYFAMVAAAAGDVELSEVGAELKRRNRLVKQSRNSAEPSP